MPRDNKLTGNTAKHKFVQTLVRNRKMNRARRGVGPYTGRVVSSTSSFDTERKYTRLHFQKIIVYKALNMEFNDRNAQVKGTLITSMTPKRQNKRS